MGKDVLAGGMVRQLTVRGDERGSLIAIEGGIDVPFPIARVYYIFGTLPGVERGFHAHRQLNQFAVCLAGSCVMVLDDGQVRDDVLLDRCDFGITIPPMIWHEMRDFSPECVLMVLADAPYEEADYIRDYDVFRSSAAGAQR